MLLFSSFCYPPIADMNKFWLVSFKVVAKVSPVNFLNSNLQYICQENFYSLLNVQTFLFTITIRKFLVSISYAEEAKLYKQGLCAPSLKIVLF